MLTTTAANIARVGIMFDLIDSHGDRPFPFLADGDLAGTPGLDEFLPYRFPVADFPGWMAVAIDPRGFSYGDEGHRAMDVTNWNVVAETIGTLHRFPWYDWSADDIARAHGAGALLTDGTLLVSPARTDIESDQGDRIDALIDLARALSDYPMLDEDAYNEQDAEAWRDFATDGLRFDTVRDLAGTLPEETVETIDDGWSTVMPAAMRFADGWYGFAGEVSPDFTVCVAHAMVTGLFAACTFRAITANSEVAR